MDAKPKRSTSWLLMFLFIATSSLIAQQAASPGSKIFRSKCALCHGADGAGKTAMGKQLQAANLGSKDVQKRPNAELRKIIHDGKSNMPPFADQLSGAEIDQVIEYVRHFGKAAASK